MKNVIHPIAAKRDRGYHFNVYRVDKVGNDGYLNCRTMKSQKTFDDCVRVSNEHERGLPKPSITLFYLFIEYQDKTEEKYLAVYAYDPIDGNTLIANKG